LVRFCFDLCALFLIFSPADAETVRRTDEAMIRHRYKLHADEHVPESIYEVTVALCCERTCTLQGHEKYGSMKVSYNLDTQSYVCIHGRSLKVNKKREKAAAAEKEEEDEEEGFVVSDDDDDDEGGNDADDVLQGEAAMEDAEDLLASAMGRLKFHAPGKAKPVTKRQLLTEERKEVRHNRKRFSGIPCGSPVLGKRVLCSCSCV
jgi:hypothetical protein